MMNRIAIYSLLILIYLGLSLGISPSSNGVKFLKNEKILANSFDEGPLSIILVDYFEAGFLIKTYYHRYKVVYGFKGFPRYMTFKVSKRYYKQNLDHLGMSLFRRKDSESEGSIIPLPPGSLYIGDLAFGRWVFRDSGEKVWKFHRAYKNFPQFFGWKEFSPNIEFLKNMKTHESQGKIYHGLNNSFGTSGVITKKAYPYFYKKDKRDRFKLKRLLKSFIQTQNYWKTNS